MTRYDNRTNIFPSVSERVLPSNCGSVSSNDEVHINSTRDLGVRCVIVVLCIKANDDQINDVVMWDLCIFS